MEPCVLVSILLLSRTGVGDNGFTPSTLPACTAGDEGQKGELFRVCPNQEAAQGLISLTTLPDNIFWRLLGEQRGLACEASDSS